MEISIAQKKYFTEQLLWWNEHENQRELAWKGEKDPYKIWLSEVILQQTRSEQGYPYYMSFISSYPDIQSLAKAKDEEVFRLWQGLGYYNRCRNMLFTARYIVNELSGKFPNTFSDILALKGVGAYTAAAIASFAYGLPHAVVDGNVYRVLSRYFAIEEPIDTTVGKKMFSGLAQDLLAKNKSVAYNQAIMYLGAIVCTPKNPLCVECPLSKKCSSKGTELTSLLPVKSKKLKVTERHFHYILFLNKDAVWIRKRTDSDIWQNLHEPYLIEGKVALEKKELIHSLSDKSIGIELSGLSYEGRLKQRLTHRVIHTYYYTADVKKADIKELKNGIWVKASDLKQYAFPKSIVSFLQKKSYF